MQARLAKAHEIERLQGQLTEALASDAKLQGRAEMLDDELKMARDSLQERDDELVELRVQVGNGRVS